MWFALVNTDQPSIRRPRSGNRPLVVGFRVCGCGVVDSPFPSNHGWLGSGLHDLPGPAWVASPLRNLPTLRGVPIAAVAWHHERENGATITKQAFNPQTGLPGGTPLPAEEAEGVQA